MRPPAINKIYDQKVYYRDYIGHIKTISKNWIVSGRIGNNLSKVPTGTIRSSKLGSIKAKPLHKGSIINISRSASPTLNLC